MTTSHAGKNLTPTIIGAEVQLTRVHITEPNRTHISMTVSLTSTVSSRLRTLPRSDSIVTATDISVLPIITVSLILITITL